MHMCTYQEALQYLDSFTNYERRTDPHYQTSYILERTRRLAGDLGNPQDGIRSVHIAGTKGKGSTAAMVASILMKEGFRVGLYTSPHLVTVRERIHVDDEPIREEEMASLVDDARPIVETFAREEGARPSFFEVVTALAFLYFRKMNVDYAVYEVGMGGRLDATNIISPLVTAITPVSFDHMESLGATLREIATEKAGIIKDGVACVVAPQEPEALDAIETVAAARGAPIWRVGKDIVFEAANAPGPMREACDIFGMFENYMRCELGLVGQHQIVNAATAVGVIEALGLSGLIVSRSSVCDGLRSVRWPGRFETLREGPLVIVDGAHNRASASALAKTVAGRCSGRRVILVLGISKDKDACGIVEELEPMADMIILTRSSVLSRAEDPSVIREFVRERRTVLTEDVGRALARAEEEASGEDVILITGSLFVAGEARSIILGGACPASETTLA